MIIRGNAWILAVAAAIYLVCTIGFALTKSPSNDEGWFAAPAYNLATHGTLGILALEPTGSWLAADLTGIRKHTYWNMPVGMVTQAAWFRLVGFGLLPMRILSILCGLVVLGSWFVIVLVLTEDRVAAYFALFLLAIDYTFLFGAADGRIDMLCLALGSAGMALYLGLRQSNFTAAILISNTCAAAGLFTHPNGIIPVLAIAGLTLYYDARRLRIRHLVAGVPYVAIVSGWLLYISQSPSDFLAQFGANSSIGGGTRFAIFKSPVSTLKLELLLRYMAHFGLQPIWTDETNHWNILIPIVYWAAMISALFSGIAKQRGNRVLLAYLLFGFFMFASNGLKLQFYLVYLMPAYAAVLAVWARYMSQRPAVVFVPVLMAPLLCLQVNTIVQLVRGDRYHTVYLPAMQYVQRNAGPASIVMGNSTAAFALGFGSLVDDERIGYFSSITPDLIVADRFYPTFWRGFSRSQPETEHYVRRKMGAEFEPRFENEYYVIYGRRKDPSIAASSRTTVSSRSASPVPRLNRNRRESGDNE